MVEQKNPIRGLSKKVKTVTVGGDVIKVKPQVKHAEMFTTLKEQRTKEDAQNVTNILYEIIQGANPEESEEDIKSHIMNNYGDWMREMTILYGFTTREEYEKVRKKLTSQ